MFDPLEAEALRAQSWSCERPVTARECLIDAFRASGSTSDLEQGTGDDSNHVVEESVSHDFDRDSVSGAAFDITLENGPHRRLSTMVGRGERLEIMRAHESRRAILHSLKVEIMMRGPDCPPIEQRSDHSSMLNLVAVFLDYRIRDRIESFGYDIRGKNLEILRTAGCDRARKAFGRDLPIRRESGNLALGVNSGVGT